MHGFDLAAALLLSSALQHGPHEHMAMPGRPEAEASEPGAPEEEPPHGHMSHEESSGTHAMTGAFGSYPASREASGTAWQPDVTPHGGLHLQTGSWTLMGHAQLNGVYDWQGGRRGDERFFVAGMAMGMARRSLGPGTLQFRAMLSPDPAMGAKGYPLLLASGETADGKTLLVDRQHPHDLFMELAASYGLNLSDRTSLFLYAGLPGEPAFGPPAFMHRLSIQDSPEAPISHHWLDSTHITFGVVTAGVVFDTVKAEVSRFNGREPDQHRTDIETGPLDSTSARLSWNPTPNLSLQASWGRFISPELLAPDENQTRWSAGGIYTRRLGERGWWSTSLAWGRKIAAHRRLDAVSLESAVGLGLWTIFGRAEYAENAELVPVDGHLGDAYRVGKMSIGAIRDFRLAPQVRVGAGATFAVNFVPGALDPLYGGDPKGAMLFVRLKVD
jgi:hypothetical protein